MTATLVVIAAVVGGAAALRWAFTRPADRKLARRRRTPVRDAEGLVRINGRARAVGELLTAPLSCRPCIAYEVVVRGPGWDLILDRREVTPFLVEDESGAVAVDPNGPCQLSLDHDLVASTSSFGPYSGAAPGAPGLVGTLRQLGVEPYDGLRIRTFAYREGILSAGEPVSVGAIVADVVDPTGERPTLRAAPQRRLLQGTEEFPLLISDAKHITRR